MTATHRVTILVLLAASALCSATPLAGADAAVQADLNADGDCSDTAESTTVPAYGPDMKVACLDGVAF